MIENPLIPNQKPLFTKRKTWKVILIGFLIVLLLLLLLWWLWPFWSHLRTGKAVTRPSIPSIVQQVIQQPRAALFGATLTINTVQGDIGKGEKGDQGITGPAGQNGLPGRPGPSGIPGTNGSNGGGASSGSITFNAGTSGSDVNVTGSPVDLGGTVTINIPDAASAARGVVNTTTQSFSGNKTFNNDLTVLGRSYFTPPAYSNGGYSMNLVTNVDGNLANTDGAGGTQSTVNITNLANYPTRIFNGILNYNSASTSNSSLTGSFQTLNVNDGTVLNAIGYNSEVINNSNISQYHRGGEASATNNGNDISMEGFITFSENYGTIHTSPGNFSQSGIVGLIRNGGTTDFLEGMNSLMKNLPGGHVNTFLTGVNSELDNNGTIDGDVYSFRALASSTNQTGVIGGNLIGYQWSPGAGSQQTITGSEYGVKLDSVSDNNVNTGYGYYLSSMNDGAVNNYGLYLGDVSGGSGQNYAIYSAGGDAYLTDGLHVGDTSNTLTGMIRYHTGTFQGWNGSSWVDFGGTGGSCTTCFQQNGNAFSATAVLGTTDANSLALETNSTQQITLDTSGNVSILNGNLSVATGKTTLAAATTGHPTLHLTSSTGTNVSSPTSGDLWWNGTNLYFHNASSNVDLLAAGATPGGSDTQVQFNNSGSFAGNSNFVWSSALSSLAVGTTAFDQTLTVGGGVSLDLSAANNGNLNNSLRFGGSGTGEAIASKRTATGNQFGLDFYTGSTPRLQIAGNGNVGISRDPTTTSSFLGIAAASTSRASFNLASSVGVNPTTPSTGDLWWNGTSLYFNNGSTNVDLLATGAGCANTCFLQRGNAFGDDAVLGTTDANALIFTTSDLTALYIDAAGNEFFTNRAGGNDILSVLQGGAPDVGYVGIGTSTPTIDLDVQGNVSGQPVAQFVNSGDNTDRLGVLIQSGENVPVGTSRLLTFQNGSGGEVGSVEFDATGTHYNTTSDVRLKKDITPTDLSVNTLMNVQVRDFNWIGRDNLTKTHGFIAQDLFQVYPQAVSVPTNPSDLWQVDFSKLMPLVVKSIQDQQVEIASLSAQSVSKTLNPSPAPIQQSPQLIANVWTWVESAVFQAKTSFLSSVDFVGQAIFRAPADFLATVVFHDRVNFEDKDMGGVTTIGAGQTSVTVTFSQPYIKAPIVTVTPVDEAVPVAVTNVTSTGFTAKLASPLLQPVSVLWTALSIKYDGQIPNAVSSTILPASPSPSPQLPGPSPTLSPISSPNPSPAASSSGTLSLDSSNSQVLGTQDAQVNTSTSSGTLP